MIVFPNQDSLGTMQRHVLSLDPRLEECIDNTIGEVLALEVQPGPHQVIEWESRQQIHNLSMLTSQLQIGY